MPAAADAGPGQPRRAGRQSRSIRTQQLLLGFPGRGQVWMAFGKGRGEVPVGSLEHAGRFSGPALRGDGDTEVMQGQADLRVVGTERRLEDPKRTEAEGFGLRIVILVAG